MLCWQWCRGKGSRGGLEQKGELGQVQTRTFTWWVANMSLESALDDSSDVDALIPSLLSVTLDRTTMRYNGCKSHSGHFPRAQWHAALSREKQDQFGGGDRP